MEADPSKASDPAKAQTLRSLAPLEVRLTVDGRGVL